jgi:2-dehydropantoate 2-reductase
MRFVIYGAGAIGGVLGGRLFQAGADVTLVARGAHGEVLRQRGLELVVGDEATVLPVPTVSDPAELDLADGDVVLLTVKSQDTEAVLDALVDNGPPGIRIVCAQNGVENERRALRRFADVYGMLVMCPSAHLDPGRVQAQWAPVAGLFDLGRYPTGADEVAEEIGAALRSATLGSVVQADIMRWKYRKLILNLTNAAAALCGPGDGTGALARRLMKEGEAVLAAAGIDVATRAEDEDRRGDLVVRGATGMDSSSQSLARGLGRIETDHLTGEIVLLGRLHGLPTPANAVVQRLAAQAAAERRPPGSLTPDEVLAAIDAAAERGATVP